MATVGMGVYVHWPYCPSKCAYCDFNAYLLPRREDAFSSYTAALVAEIRQAQRDGELTSPLTTAAFGGGTPTLFPAGDLLRVLAELRGVGLQAGAEVTVEANPGDLSATALRDLAQAGVSRLSIGAQTFSDRLLGAIGRLHTAEDVVQAVQAAKAAGLARLNLDLMYGLPEQSEADVEEALDRAIALDVGHISAYALELEPATVFGRRARQGKLALPSEAAVVAMGDRIEARLTEAGYRRYEFSNYARPGQESQHNQAVWQRGRYRGFGAGAHSFLGERRFWNLASPELYARRLAEGQSVVAGEEDVSELAMGEWVYLSLRTLVIDRERFRQDFGRAWSDVFPAATAWALDEGWLLEAGPCLLVPPGRRWLLNQVAAPFLEEGRRRPGTLTPSAETG